MFASGEVEVAEEFEFAVEVEVAVEVAVGDARQATGPVQAPGPRGPAGRTVVLDGLLAAVLAAGSVAEVLTRPDNVYESTASLPVQVTAVVLAAAPNAVRRVRPFTALLAVVGIMVGCRVLLDTPVVLWSLAVILVAVYSAARHARDPLQWWSVAPPLALIGVYSLVIPGFVNVNDLEVDLTVILAAWGVGLVLRSWARTRHALRESLAEVEAAESARTASALQAERDRIARELHDVVAHCVTVMVVQSGSARLSLHEDPAASEAALRAVEATGREALAEMRRMVGLLSDQEPEALDPQPSLAHAARLVARFAEAGMPVTFRADGAPRPLPPGVDVSAYRILQESLTNAAAHAATAPVAAVVRYRPDAVEVEVTNGRGVPSGRGSGRHGLVGMRERARLFGGTLEAGPTPDGGFRVSARLPAADDGGGR
ncbi:sensor histidine kinase [Leifsonia shinshuensis]|uniref:sensor histidine kinase n=1 Tax=Leifsonia shinshuensis TaxID=150026 RepID=UPI0016248337|nr:sensor histidine kinase [Leifsonia shinshuensis]